MIETSQVTLEVLGDLFEKHGLLKQEEQVQWYGEYYYARNVATRCGLMVTREISMDCFCYCSLLYRFDDTASVWHGGSDREHWLEATVRDAACVVVGSDPGDLGGPMWGIDEFRLMLLATRRELEGSLRGFFQGDWEFLVGVRELIDNRTRELEEKRRRLTGRHD